LRCGGLTGYATRSPTGSCISTCAATARTNQFRPEKALARFLANLAWPGRISRSTSTTAPPRYRTEINRRRMLVVLDNAASVEQIRPLLHGTPSCSVVVTSRDSLPGLVALHGGCRLDLDLLPLPDAVTLLHKLIGERVDPNPRPLPPLPLNARGCRWLCGSSLLTIST